MSNSSSGKDLNIVSSTSSGSNELASVIVSNNTQTFHANAVRPGAPGDQIQQSDQQVVPRVVIAQHVTGGAGPGASDIALRGLQKESHLLVKTDKGQYKLLRVIPTTSIAPAGPVVTSGNPSVITPTPGTSYCLASAPVVNTLNMKFPNSAAVIQTPVQQTVAANVPAKTFPPKTSTTETITTTIVANPSTSESKAADLALVNRQNDDSICNEKCHKFFINLRKSVSKDHSKTVVRNINQLIQELIDAKIEPEEFCQRLENLVNATPQPALSEFLKRSLPSFRKSLLTKEYVIDGIKLPPPNAVSCTGFVAPIVQKSSVAEQVPPPVGISSNQQDQVKLTVPQPATSLADENKRVTRSMTRKTVITESASTPLAMRKNVDSTCQEKCHKFFINLIKLISKEPEAVVRSTHVLIQELIDAKIEPEKFCQRLENLVNASPQPSLIGFLKESLPFFRKSLIMKEFVINGIRPPPPNVVFCIASTVPTVQLTRIKPSVAGQTPLPVVVSSSQQDQHKLTVQKPATSLANVSKPVSCPTTRKTVIAGPPVRHSLPPLVVSMPKASSSVPEASVRPRAKAQRAKPAVPWAGVTQMKPPVQKTVITSSKMMKPVPHTTQGKGVITATNVNKISEPPLMTKLSAKRKVEQKVSFIDLSKEGGDDDINEVTAMCGVDLAEESRRAFESTESAGIEMTSPEEDIFLHLAPLQQKIGQIVSKNGLKVPSYEVSSLISRSTKERLKYFLEKLAVIAEHRVDFNKMDPRYVVTQDVRAQLKFLEEVDETKRRREEEYEREMLLKAAKSRSAIENPGRDELKAKVKEMQRVEMEQLKLQDANETALQAVGVRKKQKLDSGEVSNSQGSNSSTTYWQLQMRPRIKRVNKRDLLFLLSQERETSRSTMLYKALISK